MPDRHRASVARMSGEEEKEVLLPPLSQFKVLTVSPPMCILKDPRTDQPWSLPPEEGWDQEEELYRAKNGGHPDMISVEQVRRHRRCHRPPPRLPRLRRPLDTRVPLRPGWPWDRNICLAAIVHGLMINLARI